MKYQLDDIAEIAAKFTEQGAGVTRDLILIAALPGVGKTTLAKEFARQTKGAHFDLDDIKRVVVPQDIVTEGIDPPEYRYKYYAEAIRKLPDLFAETPEQLVIMDETFHLQEFRQMWDEAAKELNIRLHWVEAVCDEEIVKERLNVGKNRENHILAGKGYQMHLLFKQAFEPLKGPHETVDTNKDIVPQVSRIVSERSLGEKAIS
ncbi:AAA family ATPase [Desulfococcaceae bacterium HSG7]|nr:AAA family ATPase [Desulfococcaceae bacterium HSG7]